MSPALLLQQRLSSRSSAVRCRSTGNESGSLNGVVATVERPQEAKKIESTLSALDTLLGEQAKPKAPASKPQEAPKPATPSASQSGAFSWPGTAGAQPTNRLASAAAKTQQQKKAEQAFEQVMAFEGLAPEVINARAAMLGFLAAFTTELHTGESIYAQLIAGGGVAASAVIGLVILASFAPAIRQVPMEEVFNKPKDAKKTKAFGPFAPDAEIINGRAAMIGLTAMVLLEGTSGVSFLLG